MVHRGNNAFDPSLRTNGGKDVFGTHAECYRKGYACGYNQRVKDIPQFVQKWAGQKMGGKKIASRWSENSLPNKFLEWLT